MKQVAYIINFDREYHYNLDYSQFHKILIEAKGIENWWHYLQSSYIVIVNDNINAKNIADFIRKNMPNKSFFISKLDLKDNDGWLPQEAWDWINEFNKLNL